MVNDIAFLPATRLLELYRAKELSPVAVVRETLARLERYEGALNAFVLYDPESAMAAARESEARWQKGAPRGLLDGVPIALKDTLLTRGWPRLVGSRTIDPNQAWHEDAPVTARLRAEGAVFFGKTTTPEFGWKPLTDSPLCGITRNPWNLERTPGGSSGGSAAAVLAGISPLAVGTDAGGSIRIPASFCGIFGLKPTFGRDAGYPPSAFGDVAHVGPMARTVDDAALMLDARKGPDSRDWFSLPDDGIAYRDGVRQGSLHGKRIALSPTLGYAEPAPAVRDAVERAGAVFAGLGAIGKPVALGQALRQFFDRYDLLLSPTMPIPAAYADPRGDDLPNTSNSWSWVVYTYPFNLTKNPSASIPCGFADGLPLGLQVTGPLFADLAVLQACRAYEAAAGQPWPSPALTAALATVEGVAGPEVKAKIRPLR